MYRFFESLINPFPVEDPQTPPKTLYAFCRHYTRGTELYLGIMAIFTALIAIMEVSLFGFLGQLVDWLNVHTPETLFQNAGPTLWFMASILLVGLPICVILHS